MSKPQGMSCPAVCQVAAKENLDGCQGAARANLVRHIQCQFFK